jgi:hypothetical protein
VEHDGHSPLLITHSSDKPTLSKTNSLQVVTYYSAGYMNHFFLLLFGKGPGFFLFHTVLMFSIYCIHFTISCLSKIHNSEIYTKSSRQINNFYQPTTNFTMYQKGVHYMGIKIFNSLPPYIKDISNNVRKFEVSLKRFMHIHFIAP